MKKQPFGTWAGTPVEQVVLESASASVAIIGFGASLRDWRVDGPRGTLPVALGFPRLEDYARHAEAHGAICGRVANRIRGAAFDLDGKHHTLDANIPPHHLHGGFIGLQRRVWTMEVDGAREAARLDYLSPDGEAGYPGTVAFSATYRLDGPRLICEMHAHPDQPTPINLAHHGYYNLGGAGDVRDHVVTIAAPEYLSTDADLLPDGAMLDVAGTRYDFRTPRALGQADPERAGHDVCFRLDPAREPGAPVARAACPRTGLSLAVYSDQPALQLFDAGSQQIAARGHENARYGAFSGMCLEAQHFPDSVHHPDWPSTIYGPDRPYTQHLVLEIL